MYISDPGGVSLMQEARVCLGGEGGDTGVRLDLGEGKDALHLPSWEALLYVPTIGHIHSHKCK